MPAPPLKGSLLLRRNAAGCQPLWLFLLPGSQSLRCPLPNPRRWKGCLPAGRGGGAWDSSRGLRLPETTEMTIAGRAGWHPRPRPPTCSVLFPKLRLAFSPWFLGNWELTIHPPA